MLSRLRFVVVPLVVAVVTSLPACLATDDAAEDDGESAEAESESAVVDLPADETAPAESLAAAPLDATDLLDVRGMGDSGWSGTHKNTPLPAELRNALDRFDPTGTAYRGDLTFINWETVVGSACTQFWAPFVRGRQYAFVSRVENLVQASERGFNLIGLANNHSRDCYASPDTSERGESAGPAMSVKNIEGLGDREWIWAGVSTKGAADAARARVRTFNVKGRAVRVAFGSMYVGRSDCANTACAGQKRELLESLRDAQADIRILAIHSMGPADQEMGVGIATEFVKGYNGDVVFGHGPHVWRPVRVVRKAEVFGGGTGIVFESLGNFIHPIFFRQPKNFIGRALFDVRTLKLRQVQVLPVENSPNQVTWSSANGATLPANLRWTPSTHGVYANVRP